MATSGSRLRGRLGAWLPADVPKRTILGYAAFTAFAFVVFLISTFPHELAARRLASTLAERSGWRIEFDSFAFRPWEGYRLSDVRARPAGAGIPIRAERVSARLGLRDLLFRGRTTLLLDGEAYGGSIEALVAPREDGGFEFELDEVALSEIESLREVVDGLWQGRVSGRLRLHTRGDWSALSGEGTFALADGSLTEATAGGFTIPDVRFSRGTLAFDIEEGRLEIRTAEFAGPDLEANVRGRIHLRRPPERSLLDLNLELHPLPGARSGLEPLLLLWNRNQKPPDGRYRLGVGGSIDAPRLR